MKQDLPGEPASARAVSRTANVAPIGGTTRRRRHGWLAGAALSLALMLVLLAPQQVHSRAPGPMNVGHEALTCEHCHVPAQGTIRQQLQANSRYWLGFRASPVDFGSGDVRNSDCLACHERPFDRHPVFRFEEPRFAEARRELGVNECQSCHAEHRGAKVVVEATYCKQCHSKLKLARDPIDVTHEELVTGARWETCLGCHDFHGNHERTTPEKLDAALSPARVASYFAGSSSPYGEALKSPPRKERADVRK